MEILSKLSTVLSDRAGRRRALRRRPAEPSLEGEPNKPCSPDNRPVRRAWTMAVHRQLSAASCTAETDAKSHRRAEFQQRARAPIASMDSCAASHGG
jgi:hypothetical protein